MRIDAQTRRLLNIGAITNEKGNRCYSVIVLAQSRSTAESLFVVNADAKMHTIHVPAQATIATKSRSILAQHISFRCQRQIQ